MSDQGTSRPQAGSLSPWLGIGTYFSKHVERIRLDVPLELLPRDRRCDRKSGTGTRRVSADGRGSSAVAQIVDEEPARALNKRGVRGVPVGVGSGEALRQLFAIGGMRPVMRHTALDRHHDMNPLATREFRPTVVTLSLEKFAKRKGRLAHKRPFDSVTRIKIEYEHVGMLNVLHCAVPGMQLNRSNRDQAE